MTQYNDRPVPKWYNKVVLRPSLEFPRNARLHFARRDFWMRFPISMIAFAGVLMAVFMIFSGKGHFGLLFLLFFGLFWIRDNVDGYKEIKKNRNLTDIEALYLMGNNSIVMYGADTLYAQVWVDNYPHWAERIDPETGNIDPKRTPSDKPWEEVKEEIKVMMQAYAQEKQSISETKQPSSL